jgi:enoyl-CoA hydratase
LDRPATSSAAEGLGVSAQAAAAVVTLDRGGARNALTIAMRRTLAEAVPRIARDPQIYAVVIRSAVAGTFASGGDVREMAALAAADLPAAHAAFADECALCWLIECFSKPTVSIIDGAVMGTGVGISLYGTHRVAGEGYTFAMPETALGFFPDCGLAHAFARMPDGMGLFLGLTGRRIGRADALALGLVTHCIDAPAHAGILEALACAEPIDPLLERLHRDPGVGELSQHREMVARCFLAGSVHEIRRRLAAEAGASAAFAREALADLDRAAPLSLAVTLRHIREAAARDLRQTLMLDHRIGAAMMGAPDFREGVRAILVDKDRSPRWRPAAHADVTPGMVERCFAPRPGADLVLPTRQEMQAARV